MRGIPKSIDLDKLPGWERGKYPALFFRDEISWSPSGSSFALAYTITEVSYGNDVGSVLWGIQSGSESRVLGNPTNLNACCWFTPWCSWITDDLFIFKTQLYKDQRLYLPLIAISLSGESAIIPGTNNTESRPSDIAKVTVSLAKVSWDSLHQQIENSA